MKEYQQACVGAFILNKEGKFLIVKRSDTDDFLPGLWELPGGGTDFGEEPQDAVVREIKEEAGILVGVVKPVAVSTHFMKKNNEKIQRIEITFLCNVISSEEITLSFEHSEYTWLYTSAISTIDFTPYMKNVIEESIKNI